MNEVSRETSWRIFDDARKAWADDQHPCHRFVESQTRHGVPVDRWQLPEPFNGWSSTSGIVFLALNPSFGIDEPVPRINSSFEAWDTFYRARFDHMPPDLHFLYKRYQLLGEHAVGPAFRLGIDAIVLEAVRFKSWRSEGTRDQDVLAHERILLEELLGDIAPRVVVCQTNIAGNQLAVLSREFRASWEKAPTLGALEGTAIAADFPWGHTYVAASRHFTAAVGMSNEARHRVAEAVKSALAKV